MKRLLTRNLLLGIAFVAIPGGATPGVALAENLRDALITAYTTNPDLQAARSTQRANDENVPIARAAALPSLSATANYTTTPEKAAYGYFDVTPNHQVTVTANLGAPIYSGGAIRNSIRAASTRVVAGQASLRGTESSIFAQVVTAYLDVMQDAAITGLNRNNVQVLEVNLKATSDRFEIGDVTRTDVAQSNSRLALARADLKSAEANLISAREEYIQIVGKAPGDLATPPPLAGLPASPDDAVAIALERNPDLAAARLASKAAGFDVRTAEAGRLPKLSAFATGNYNSALGTLAPIAVSEGYFPHTSTLQVGLSATIPLYQGGLPAAQVRQAQANEGSALEKEISAEREVIATVRSAYANWQAANEAIKMNRTAVEAAALSLEGVRAENTVGNRTILNILDAEQELLRAQVQLVTAQRNAYVAGFNLLAAMGRAEARDLALDSGDGNVALYDPTTNYDRVKGKIWDWGQDPSPTPVSIRTVDTPAQNANVPSQPLP